MATESTRNKDKLFDGLNGKGNSEIDSCYKLFLEHLKKDEDSYVLEVPDGDHGMPTFVRYEEEDVRYGDANCKNGTNFSNNSLRKNQGHPTVKWASAMGSNSNVKHSFSLRTSSAKRSLAEDESYKKFLSLLKVKDGLMVVEIEPGIPIIYEQESETCATPGNLSTENVTNEQEHVMTPMENMNTEDIICTDEEGLARAESVISEHKMVGPASRNLDNGNAICTDDRRLVLYNHPCDVTASEDDQGSILALSCYDPSTFDKKLNDVLSHPYDQTEYEELMRKATDRKPVSRQRHLRSASKRYATEAIGLSYLDHYPELAVKIDTADCYEKLNLLRKLFFWLENLCHDGAYKPWTSKTQACDPIATDEYEPVLALEMPKDEN